MWQVSSSVLFHVTRVIICSISRDTCHHLFYFTWHVLSSVLEDIILIFICRLFKAVPIKHNIQPCRVYDCDLRLALTIPCYQALLMYTLTSTNLYQCFFLKAKIVVSAPKLRLNNTFYLAKYYWLWTFFIWTEFRRTSGARHLLSIIVLRNPLSLAVLSYKVASPRSHYNRCPNMACKTCAIN